MNKWKVRDIQVFAVIGIVFGAILLLPGLVVYAIRRILKGK